MIKFFAVGLLAASAWATAPAARAGDLPCSELASAVDLSASPSDDRRVFCKFAKDTVAGGCCKSSLYDCLKAKPTCARAQALAVVGRGIIATGAAEDKAVAAAADYEDGFAPEKRNPVDASKYPCKGPKDGITIVEFSDFDCPHCAAAVPLLQKLLAQDKGVRLCSITFPLPGHRYSVFASVASLYADSQGKFWPMAEALFESQNDREGLEEDAYKKQLVAVGQKVGLDPKALAAALTDKSPLMEKVKDQQMLGISMLVQATPSFYVEGRSLNGVPLTSLAVVVRDERESQGKK